MMHYIINGQIFSENVLSEEVKSEYWNMSLDLGGILYSMKALEGTDRWCIPFNADEKGIEELRKLCDFLLEEVKRTFPDAKYRIEDEMKECGHMSIYFYTRQLTEEEHAARDAEMEMNDDLDLNSGPEYPVRAKRPFTLMDAEAQNAKYPNSFFIPDLQKRQWMKPGDYVQLGFEDSVHGTERMWVQITELMENGYRATVANDPVCADLRFGDVVEFEYKHILKTQ